MANSIQESSQLPELKKRAIFTILMLMIYRIGIFVPTPGIDNEKIKNFFGNTNNSLFGMVNMFSGGALEQASVFALGIVPYISVSIMVQVLATIYKPLEELQKEGEHGKRIITRYTRIGTIILALIQGYVISIGLEKQGFVLEGGQSFRLVSALTLASGTAFLMWMGEQITERGLGNGISIIIMAGIIARMPATLFQTFQLVGSSEMTPIALLAILAFAFLTVVFIVFIERSQRRIPIQYPRRVVGRQMVESQTQHLPLKINTSGVMPPIFASALITGFIMLLTTVSPMVNSEILTRISSYFQPQSLGYEILFALMIIFFSYFYTSIIFDPNKVSENLKKNGAFIPTVRPGKDTSDFLDRLLTRLTLWGALYLVIICILPSIFYFKMGASAFTYFFGGTAILIVVGVAMDTVSQVESYMMNKNYEAFISKSGSKSKGGGRVHQSKGKLIQR